MPKIPKKKLDATETELHSENDDLKKQIRKAEKERVEARRELAAIKAQRQASEKEPDLMPPEKSTDNTIPQ